MSFLTKKMDSIKGYVEMGDFFYLETLIDRPRPLHGPTNCTFSTTLDIEMTFCSQHISEDTSETAAIVLDDMRKTNNNIQQHPGI